MYKYHIADRSCRLRFTMLFQFIIITNVISLALAAITEKNVAATTDIDYTTLKVSFPYPGTIEANSTTTTTEKPTCRSDQWQCADGACVPEEHKCDGAFHCEDGSDETRALCKDSTRHMLGLLMHCTADRWNLKEGVCPDICKVQPEYCTYAILAEQNPTPPGVCVLPDFVRNGTYNVTSLHRTTEFGVKDFFLDFECDYGTELVGEAKLECINGTWSGEKPYCSETCKLKRKPELEYTYTCIRGDKRKQCGEFVAIGTEIVVEKNDKKVSNSSIKAYALCTEERVLNVTSKCVRAVDERQENFEKETMDKLSDFENKFKETKQPSFAFEELVRNYRLFEDHVTKNSTDLAIQVAVCGIHLDLMESSQA